MAYVICDADHYVEHLRLALEQPLDMSRVRFRWGGRLETIGCTAHSTPGSKPA